jgi:hypothetical protein
MTSKTIIALLLCIAPALLVVVFATAPVSDANASDFARPPEVVGTPQVTESHYVYIPVVQRAVWVAAPLQNGDFEAGWWRETFTGEEYNELFVPEGWIAFWREGWPYGRPEMKIIPNEYPYLNPARVYTGQQALGWFTFYRSGDAGVYQQMPATHGSIYKAKAFAHVWYSQLDDAHLSEWVDEDGITHTIRSGDPGMDVMLGLDPTGGTNPWAPTVVWTRTSIYDQFGSLEVQATAQALSVTLFLRAEALYPFKHCDAYWDNVSLEVLL